VIFQENATWKKHDFFPYEVVISFFPKNFGHFLINPRNFAKICYFIENSTFLPFGGKIQKFFYEKKWEKNPDTKDIHG
jgi:hypothetical protein